MGFPAGAQTTVLTMALGFVDGSGERETVTITPSVPQIVSTALNDIREGDPVLVTSDRGTGTASVRLLNTDASGYNPSGWTYTIQRGNHTPYSISLPSSLGATADLADLTPVTSSPGTYDLLIHASELGNSATRNVGTTAGTVAAGDDPRFNSASPWRFNIETYGAVADVQVVTDGATQTGVAQVTCATSRPFANSSVGKICIILGAGPTGVTSFASPITGYTNSSTVQLQDAPAQTLAGATVIIGSNSYAAANAATNAAEDYLNGTGTGAAAVPHSYAQVYTPPNAYIIHGPLQTTKQGNGQVVFGVYDPTKRKPGLDYAGESPVAAAVRHWQQLVPQGGGSCWISTFVYSSTSAANSDQDPSAHGLAGIISGPNEGTTNGTAYGSVIAGTATYSNVLPMIRNMSFLTAHSALGLSIGAANLFGCANMLIENVSESTLGIVPTTDYQSPPSFSAGFSVGLVGPSPGNNDMSYVRNLSIQGGHTFGAWFSEHTVVDRFMCLYTWAALGIVGSYGGSVGASHAVKVIQASIEACTHELYFIGVGSQGITMVDVDQLQTEDGHPNICGNSAGAVAAGVGRVKWTGLFDADQVVAQLTDGTPTPCGIEQVNGQVPRAIRRVTGAYAVKVLDRTIVTDTSGGGFTATLPAADFVAVEYVFKNVGSNSLTVATTGGQLIYTTSGTGAATATVATGGTLRVQAMYNGSAWGWYAV